MKNFTDIQDRFIKSAFEDLWDQDEDVTPSNIMEELEFNHHDQWVSISDVECWLDQHGDDFMRILEE